MHPAYFQREFLTSGKFQNRIFLPEDPFAFSAEGDAVQYFSLLFSRKDIRAGKDFQPEMNAQMLIRHRVDISVRYVSRAKALGADYALVVTPYYNKPSDEGILRHFEAAACVGIPIIVYNIAGRTGKNISVPLLARIAELPNIAGVKEASGSVSQMMDVIAQVQSRHPDFSVLSGDDSLTLALTALGGDGVISVVSNLAPAEMTEMTNAALNGDMERARALHYRLLPFMKAAFVETNPCPIKYALSCKGLPSGGLRLPLVPVLPESRKIIEDAMKESGLW